MSPNNQNKRPVLLRTLFCIVTVAIFALAMYPLQERDFMTVFNSQIQPDRVTDSSRVQALNMILAEVDSYAAADSLPISTAMLELSNKYNLNLCDFFRPSLELRQSKDLIAKIKKDCAGSLRLGIDLDGGLELLIGLDDITDTSGNGAELMDFNDKADRARELIRTRLEQIGIYESELSVQGGRFINLRAPINSREEKESLKSQILQAAKLRFRLVSTENEVEVAKYRDALERNEPDAYTPPPGTEIMRSTSIKNGELVTDFELVEKTVQMTGNDIRKAYVGRDQNGQIQIHLEFNATGTRDFARVTSANVGRRLAIVLDGTLYSAPVLRVAINNGMAVIDGDFTHDEALVVARALSSGNLPFNMVVAGEFDVDPTLGAANVESGMKACVIGMLAVMLFMFIYYPKTGWIANVALLANIVLIMGALAAFQQTLTLPGIAGLLLTIGMAVDANILINERMREEIRDGKSVFHAIQNGYDQAFITIFDSNITTLLMGLILIWFSTGAVKGFAIVLSIGILTSMFTSLMGTRVIFDILSRFDIPKSLPSFSFLGLGTERTFNFLSIRKAVFALSAFLVIGSIAVFAIRGSDTLSIDFRGGTQISLEYKTQVDEGILQSVLVKNGVTGAKVTYKGTTAQQLVEFVIPEAAWQQYLQNVDTSNVVAGADAERIGAMVATQRIGKFLDDAPETGDYLVKIKNPETGEITYQADTREIGGLVGWSFLKTSLLSIFLAFVGILIYITLRFEMVYGFGATIALLHDVIIAAGIYLLLGNEISLIVVAALLTLYGYSLNNTIVIYDRIRMERRLFPERSFGVTINTAINRTLSRTMLTTITVLLPVVVLLLFGGVAIKDFALVLFIGLLVGTYSSVCLASPIVYWWHNRFGIVHEDDSEIEAAPEVQRKSL